MRGSNDDRLPTSDKEDRTFDVGTVSDENYNEDAFMNDIFAGEIDVDDPFGDSGFHDDFTKTNRPAPSAPPKKPDPPKTPAPSENPGGKRQILRILVICFVLLLAAAAALFFTGIMEKTFGLKLSVSLVDTTEKQEPSAELRAESTAPAPTATPVPKPTSTPTERPAESPTPTPPQQPAVEPTAPATSSAPPSGGESQDKDPPSPTKDPNVAIGSVTILVHALRIRQSPSTDGQELGKTTKGESFRVFEIESATEYTWYRIGQDAWVADKGGKYVFFSDDAAPTSWDLDRALGSIEILVDALRIRVSPGTHAEETIWTGKGDRFQVYEIVTADGYTWYKAGPEAWIADKGGEYIRFTAQ